MGKCYSKVKKKTMIFFKMEMFFWDKGSCSRRTCFSQKKSCEYIFFISKTCIPPRESMHSPKEDMHFEETHISKTKRGLVQMEMLFCEETVVCQEGIVLLGSCRTCHDFRTGLTLEPDIIWYIS